MEKSTMNESAKRRLAMEMASGEKICDEEMREICARTVRKAVMEERMMKKGVTREEAGG